MKRSLTKRNIGGFLGYDDTANPQVCTDAYVFLIGGGQLLAENQPLWGNASLEYEAVTNLGPPPTGAITTDFELVDDLLSWRNPAFVDGEAFYCQVANSGQVFFTFEASQADWPPNCQQIYLQAFPGKFFHLLWDSALLGFSISSFYSPNPSLL